MPSIYGLYDTDGNLRYIGKANNPHTRLASHLRDASRRDTPVYRWIRKNGTPEMRVLIADCVDWKADEQRLISEARERGVRLLNVADGGDEPFCPIEVRRKNGVKAAAARRATPHKRAVYDAKQRLGAMAGDTSISDFTRTYLHAHMRALFDYFPADFANWGSLPPLPTLIQRLAMEAAKLSGSLADRAPHCLAKAEALLMARKTTGAPLFSP